MRKIALSAWLAVLACLLPAHADIAYLPNTSSVVASLQEIHSCALDGCASGDHLAFFGGSMTQTHPSLTNCDITTAYTTDANVASRGRCRLVPGVYRIFLGLNMTASGSTCSTSIAVYNTTTTFPETSSQQSDIEVWVALNTYNSGTSLMNSDMGIVTITAQSWIEARFVQAECADIDGMDGGHMVIERIGEYVP